MSASANLGSVFVILMLNLFPKATQTPPRDLASLVAPQAALERLGVATDDAALVAVLGESAAVLAPDALERAVEGLAAEQFAVRQQSADILRNAGPAAAPFLEKAAASDDPEVRTAAADILNTLKASARSGPLPMGDVKKLLAIRLLEQRKSSAARERLTQLAAGRDPMLAVAAREALSAIAGQPPAQTPADEWLRAVSRHVPADAGFVGFFRFDRGRSDVPLAAAVGALYEDPALKDFPGGLPPQPSLVEWIERGVCNLLGRAGNIRLDAVAAVLSNDLGPQRRGYAAFLVRGRWDPERLRNAFGRAFRATAAWEEKPVQFSPGGFGLCVLGAQDLVFIGAPDLSEESLRDVLDALVKGPEHDPTPDAQQALDAVLDPACWAAVSGALGAAQKAAVSAEAERIKQRRAARPANAPRPDDVLMPFCAGLAGTRHLFGRWRPDGFVVEAEEENLESAEEFAKAVTGVGDFFGAQLGKGWPGGMMGQPLRVIRTEDRRVDIAFDPRIFAMFAGLRVATPTVPPPR